MQQNEYTMHSKYIKSLINYRKAIVGRNLNETIENKYAITRAYARTIVCREISKETILLTKPVTFGLKQYGYYLGDLTNEKILILSKERPSMNRLISALLENKGILSYLEALKICASPVGKSNNKKSSLDNIIRDLTSLDFIKSVESYKNVKFICSNFFDSNNNALENYYNKIRLDVILNRDIITWLRKTNLIENEKEYRSINTLVKGVISNNYVWDAVGFNRATGFNTVYESNKKSENKNAFVVIDIKINSEYTVLDLNGFYSRVQNVLCSSKERKYKIIPIIFTKNISDEAKAKCLNLGFIHFGLGVIYGDKIFKIIDSYSNIFSLISDEYNQDNSSLSDLIETTLLNLKDSGQEDNLNNIKCDLFEYLIFIYLKETLNGYSIEHSVKIPKSYEYDFIAKNNSTNECIIFEVKGYKHTSSTKLETAKKKIL